jgi:hypothetical protein
MRNLITAIGLGLIAIWTMFWLGVMYVFDTVIEFFERLWEKRKQKRKT